MIVTRLLMMIKLSYSIVMLTLIPAIAADKQQIHQREHFERKKTLNLNLQFT